ncbi:MAG: ABC transporter ATP-binding protein [Anaerolineales bacterium]
MREHPPFLELRNVTKIYPTPWGGHAALDNINIRVQRGELVVIMGKSGSGKSTLLNMVSGIDRPTSGEVYVNGVAIHALSEKELTAWRGQKLGIVFQFFQLMPTLTLVENVILPMELNRTYSPIDRQRRALRLCELVEMAAHREKLPSMVSGGEQQRIAIARALANDPPLILADEPTGNLDSTTAETIFRLFDELVKGGKTLLLLTHDHDLARRAQRALLIADGRIVNEDGESPPVVRETS